jgi:hypothetical protein
LWLQNAHHEGRRLPQLKMNNGNTSRPWGRIAPFAVISLVSFGSAASLLFFMVWKADVLVGLGLVGRFYYVLLLPLGLCSAAFLFGVLQAYAGYRGKQLGGTLTLRGPIVACFMVVILGFVLVPDISTFPQTIYVHGPGGPRDIVLRNSGEVFIDLGDDRRHVQIGDQGQAYVPAVPASFRNQYVPVWVSSDNYESVDQEKRLKLDGRSIYLPVRRKAVRIYGRVDGEGGGCLFGAEVSVAGLSAPIDPRSGHFELTIPGDRLRDDLELVATAPGCVSKSYRVFPNSNEIEMTLRKSLAK